MARNQRSLAWKMVMHCPQEVGYGLRVDEWVAFLLVVHELRSYRARLLQRHTVLLLGCEWVLLIKKEEWT